MKSLYLKVAASLMVLFLVVGVTQYSHAAFPGKQQQTKEVTVKADQVTSDESQSTTAPKPIDDNTLLLVILALILPPLAVYLKYDEAGKPFIINIILTLLCGLPGVIHALYHVLKD